MAALPRCPHRRVAETWFAKALYLIFHACGRDIILSSSNISQMKSVCFDNNNKIGLPSLGRGLNSRQAS